MIDVSNLIHFKHVETPNFGGKANNLAHLHKEGYNVPEGFVIPFQLINRELISIGFNEQMDSAEQAEFIKDNKLDSLLEQIWKLIPKKIKNTSSLAIRSSANVEDGTKFSFAGQFETYLDITTIENFKEAVLKCFLSKYAPIVTSYCKRNEIAISSIQVNVIVQEFIQSDYSGVCFTVNPLTGEDTEMIIESVKGIGENLVQGIVTPSSYHFDWYKNKIKEVNKTEENNLSEKNLFLLKDECLKIQQLYGTPQDIEWVIKDNELYIVQSRPMTSIRYKVSNDWTNADLKDGGISSEVTTPFMYSLYESVFSTTLPAYLKSVHLHPKYKPEKWFNNFMLFSYWNLTATKDGVKKTPGYIERDLDEDLGVEIQYMGKGHITKTTLKSIFDGIKILLALKKSIKNTIKNADFELADIKEVIHTSKENDFLSGTNEETKKYFDQLIFNDYQKIESAYFTVIYNNANNSTLFRDLLDKKGNKYKVSYLKLVSGLDDISHLRPIEDIWKLSEKIKTETHVKDYFLKIKTDELVQCYSNQSVQFYNSELKALIDKYAHHSEKELNLLHPNWDENPKQLFNTLKTFLEDKGIDFSESHAKQVSIYKQEISKIESKKLLKEIEKYRYLLWLREEYRDHSTRFYNVIRKSLLQIGTRLVNQSIINEQYDVFFLTPKELSCALVHDKNINVKDIVSKNRIRFNSFKNYDRPNEIWSNNTKNVKKVKSDLNNLKGIACSSGEITGEIYIAHTIEDAEKMPTGKIMVTKFTDPAWTVYFSKISGLITETGGMLSHGAIISREFGIPAVLGIKNITQTLKTGDKVTLNGDLGSVCIAK